jgi:hypothetical protein
MEIYISDWTHKFQNKTGLDAKDNSELYKSKRVCSVPARRAQRSIQGRYVRVLLETLFASVSTISRGHASQVSLVVVFMYRSVPLCTLQYPADF